MMDHVGQDGRVSVGMECRCHESVLLIRLPVKRAAAEGVRLL